MENPYASPKASTGIRTKKAIWLLLAVFFACLGAIVFVGALSEMLITLVTDQDMTLRTVAGLLSFVVGGLLWIISAKAWGRSQWRIATVLALTAYGIAVVGALLTRLSSLPH